MTLEHYTKNKKHINKDIKTIESHGFTVEVKTGQDVYILITHGDMYVICSRSCDLENIAMILDEYSGSL